MILKYGIHRAYPAPYSPPTACRSKSTGRSKPSLTPSMWMVSRLMVIPFQPRRIAPLGDPLQVQVLQRGILSLPSLLESHLLDLNRCRSDRRLLEDTPNAFASFNSLQKNFVIRVITMLTRISLVSHGSLIHVSPGEIEELPCTSVNMRLDPLI